MAVAVVVVVIYLTGHDILADTGYGLWLFLILFLTILSWPAGFFFTSWPAGFFFTSRGGDTGGVVTGPVTTPPPGTWMDRAMGRAGAYGP